MVPWTVACCKYPTRFVIPAPAITVASTKRVPALVLCKECGQIEGLFRCKDCFGGRILCRDCLLNTHAVLPLHRVIVRLSLLSYFLLSPRFCRNGLEHSLTVQLLRSKVLRSISATMALLALHLVRRITASRLSIQMGSIRCTYYFAAAQFKKAQNAASFSVQACSLHLLKILKLRLPSTSLTAFICSPIRGSYQPTTFIGDWFA